MRKRIHVKTVWGRVSDPRAVAKPRLVFRLMKLRQCATEPLQSASPWPGRVRDPPLHEQRRAIVPGPAAFFRGAHLPDRRVPLRGGPARIRFGFIGKQIHQDQRKFCSHHAESVLALKQADYVAKIFSVIADHDGHAVLRRLNDIVSAARNQAATHECDISQGIE